MKIYYKMLDIKVMLGKFDITYIWKKCFKSSILFVNLRGDKKLIL